MTSFVAAEFPALFDSPECTVRALLPERTFWEKVMLLHEEPFRPQDKVRQARLARHYYDVWRLIETGVATRAAANLDLFEQVAAHRRVYFRRGWVDYDSLKHAFDRRSKITRSLNGVANLASVRPRNRHVLLAREVGAQ